MHFAAMKENSRFFHQFRMELLYCQLCRPVAAAVIDTRMTILTYTIFCCFANASFCCGSSVVMNW